MTYHDGSSQEFGVFEIESTPTAHLVTVRVPGEAYGTTVSIPRQQQRKLNKVAPYLGGTHKEEAASTSIRLLDALDADVSIIIQHECEKHPLGPVTLEVQVQQGGRSFPAPAQRVGRGFYKVYFPVEKVENLSKEAMIELCQSHSDVFALLDTLCELYGKTQGNVECPVFCAGCAQAGPAFPLCVEVCAVACTALPVVCIPSQATGGDSQKLCELLAEHAIGALEDYFRQEEVVIYAFASFEDGSLEDSFTNFQPGDEASDIVIEHLPPDCVGRCCGGVCCKEGRHCCDNKECCYDFQQCCGGKQCCQKCCRDGPVDSYWYCCALDEKCCGGKCCDCKVDEWACDDGPPGSENYCCAESWQCCGGQCCSNCCRGGGEYESIHVCCEEEGRCIDSWGGQYKSPQCCPPDEQGCELFPGGPIECCEKCWCQIGGDKCMCCKLGENACFEGGLCCLADEMCCHGVCCPRGKCCNDDTCCFDGTCCLDGCCPTPCDAWRLCPN